MLGDLSREWRGLGEALRVMGTVARRELLVELRGRNKLALDLTGHLLGLGPVLLTAWAASGARSAPLLLPDAARPLGASLPSSVPVDWLTFVLLGYVAFAAYGVASPVISFTGMAFALQSEQALGTLERSLLAPAPRVVVVLGSGVYYTALFAFHVLTLLVASALFRDLRVQLSAPTLLLAATVLLLIFVMSVGFGVLSAAILLAWKDASLMMIAVHRPMLLLSGAYFLIPTVPEPFRSLAWLNPIAYAVDAFRGALSGATVLLPLPAELAILALTSFGILAGGLVLFDRLMSSWLRSGALGGY
jgi:ABC-2 type transport system permease protein